jgi:phosphoribosyl 1,2-cyclic phosphodiesterase
MASLRNSEALPQDPDEISIRFWGTRGSLPRPSPEMMRYGGDTTCLEVRLGERLFIVDAGSGIATAGPVLAAEQRREFTLLFSHLHHDHIAGVPFFTPALNANCTIHTFCGNLGGASAEAAFDRMFAPPLFPVTLSQLPARFVHHGFKAGAALDIDGVAIRTLPLPHPGGATAYRFDHAGSSFCYVSDIEHTPGVTDAGLIAFCAGADLVVYDTMFNDEEFTACRGWGHSTVGAGVSLCQAAGAKALAGTHHHIRHTDAMLDAVDAHLRKLLPGSFMARQGQVVRLHKPRAATRRLARVRETLV